VKLVFWLVGIAAALFIIGGVGTIATMIGGSSPAVRVVFMYVFLAGLIPTMLLLVLALAVGAYHLYLNRVAGREPTGWIASEKKSGDD
jgi:hypothetical protein